MRRKHQDYDWEESEKVEWEDHGASYTLNFTMYDYAYEDEDGGHCGSGVRGLLLTIIKTGNDGKQLHCWEEIDVDGIKKYEDIAEGEFEAVKDSYRD